MTILVIAGNEPTDLHPTIRKVVSSRNTTLGQLLDQFECDAILVKVRPMMAVRDLATDSITYESQK